MSQFFTKRLRALIPYVPGEQPQDKQYIKLNTNESPFPPSEGVIRAVANEAEKLRLYSDPECVELRKAMSAVYGLPEDWFIMNNGSDETLNFAFMAFADEERPLVFPDITYGFYPVFAEINRIPYEEIPLTDDYSVNPADYIGVGKTVVLANPNAPTGKVLPLCEIEKIVSSNPNNVVIVDEAYVDFGGESAVVLVKKYPNLLVVGTFSKSRSMAGARLGFGIGNPALIADLNTIRYSTNPYNINRLTSVAGVAALSEQAYYDEKCKVIIENRAWTTAELEKLGFTVLQSKTNFVFAKSDKIDGEELYLALKERGILVRHFTKERIRDFNRITVGTREQMQTLITTVIEIMKEKTK